MLFRRDKEAKQGEKGAVFTSWKHNFWVAPDKTFQLEEGCRLKAGAQKGKAAPWHKPQACPGDRASRTTIPPPTFKKIPLILPKILSILSQNEAATRSGTGIFKVLTIYFYFNTTLKLKSLINDGDKSPGI
jgi:hypothetical protein